MENSTAAAAAAHHVLVVPYPAQGHMIPILDLTHHLAVRGVTITILVTPQNVPILGPLLSHCPASSIATLVLPFPPHPSIPAAVENTKDLPPNSFRPVMVSMGRLYSPLLRWFQSHPSPPSAILSDMFLGWTHRLASQLGIKRIVFSPSGALALSVIYSLWRDFPRRADERDDNAEVSFDKIPGSPKYPWWQLSPVYRSYVAGDPDSEFIKDGMKKNLESWGLVINSFSELESVYLNHLMSELGHDRVWAVGPLLPPENGNGSGPCNRPGPSPVATSDILSWLDTCHDQKVVYVCFGSQALLTNQQMEAIARGLEKSGSHFIWSVKQPATGHANGAIERYGTVPQGFDARVAGRGLVVTGWVPQVLILRHRAVGAFLTHCGWNSVLEGLVAGVPMLAWPMGADQYSNATLLVDVLKAGVRVCEGSRTVPDSDELAQALANSVSEDRGKRKRAQELRTAALDAISDGGSSSTDLERLIKHLSI
ncbi:hypothetical protein Nepgr_019353 [Nepenthes gracilis]|uniref:Glycosyltransferase n=1 Tax=Nepenthes gracilis TaxID=150966 RepID=A0AAD3SUR6_NEPGR|nr:hypothetical protein Nepgr_019353 [Nepenthes gracilis]